MTTLGEFRFGRKLQPTSKPVSIRSPAYAFGSGTMLVHVEPLSNAMFCRNGSCGANFPLQRHSPVSLPVFHVTIWGKKWEKKITMGAED